VADLKLNWTEQWCGRPEIELDWMA